MKDLVRDDVVAEGAGTFDVNLTRAGRCDRVDQRVPAARRDRNAAGDRIRCGAARGEVVDRDVDQAVAAVGDGGGVTPTAVQGIRALGHSENVSSLLLGDGRSRAGREVTAEVDHEVVAGKGHRARRKRVDRSSAWHTHSQRGCEREHGKGQQESRRWRHLWPDRLWPRIPLATRSVVVQVDQRDRDRPGDDQDHDPDQNQRQHHVLAGDLAGGLDRLVRSTGPGVSAARFLSSRGGGRRPSPRRAARGRGERNGRERRRGGAWCSAAARARAIGTPHRAQAPLRDRRGRAAPR